MQVLPAPVLRPYIKHFILLKCTDMAAQQFRFFADGSMSMVLTFQDSTLKLKQANGDLQKLPLGFLYGHNKQYQDVQIEINTTLVIVVFQPAGVKSLFDLAPQEIQDSFLDLKDLFGSILEDLYEKINQTSAMIQKLDALNQFFSAFLPKKSRQANPILYFSLQYLIENKEECSIATLSEKVGYSERQIERVFQEFVGISPKSYSNIIRFHHFLSLLRSDSNGFNLTELCYTAGYYDQSHLIKEFKKKVGIKPSAYLQTTQKLTSNFIEIVR